MSVWGMTSGVSEPLEIQTEHADTASLVRDLSARVGDASIELTAARGVEVGEWLRFVVLLRDRSPVFEGVGRCASSVEREQGFSVTLTDLSFDEPNQVMFERLRLEEASDLARALPPPDVGPEDRAKAEDREAGPAQPAPMLPVAPDEEVVPRAAASRSEGVVASGPQSPSSAPAASSSTHEGAKKAVTRKARPTVPRPKHRPPTSFPPPRMPESVRPAARRSTRPPARPSAGKKRPEALRVPVVAAAEVGTQDTMVSQAAESPTKGSALRATSLRLDVPRFLVARAQALAPTLPPGVVDAKASGRSAEEIVLYAALRLGLASLAALAEASDDLP